MADGCRKSLRFFFIKGQLIFRRDKAVKYPVVQLASPRVRVQKILELAHNDIFACHFAEKKTRERIRQASFWPLLHNDIRLFTRSFEECQVRARLHASDRVPIKPIVRPDTAWARTNVDCIGPIEPPSRSLCIVYY